MIASKKHPNFQKRNGDNQLTTWSICSVMYSDTDVVIKVSQSINLGWLENQYTEKIFSFHQEKAEGFLKFKVVYDKGKKVGEQYPFWYYDLSTSQLNNAKLGPSISAYEIAWQVIHYLTADGWEPFSTNFDVAGSGNSAGMTIAGTPEFVFRKAFNG